jgi:hypothetical protein
MRIIWLSANYARNLNDRFTFVVFLFVVIGATEESACCSSSTLTLEPPVPLQWILVRLLIATLQRRNNFAEDNARAAATPLPNFARSRSGHVGETPEGLSLLSNGVRQGCDEKDALTTILESVVAEAGGPVAQRLY